MTPYDTHQVISSIKSLFPKSDWTEELYGLFAAQTGKLDVQLAGAIEAVNRYRIETRRRTPDLGTLVRRLLERRTIPAPRPQAEDRRPLPFRPDTIHPGVLTRKDGQDVVVSWEQYAAANGYTLTAFRKANPTPK